MTMKNIVRLLALVAILTAAALPASAQWGPEEEKNCFLNGKKGTITLSGQSNSAQGDSSKLEQFEEIPNGFLVPCAAYGWSNENYFLDLKAIDALYDDQFLGATFGKKGGFLLDLTWDENPNWQSNTARSVYTESLARRLRGPGRRCAATCRTSTPPGSRRPPATRSGIGSAPANPTVPGFYAVENYVNTSLPTFDLRYVRKTGRAGISVPVGQAFVFDASYSREKRDGNKNTTFYGGPSYEVASPIEFVTDNFRFGGEFAKGRFFLAASVDFSEFKNEVPFVEVDNPERLQMANPTNGRNVVNDAAFFRLWMPPDNEAYQADFTGGITLPARHKVTGSLSTGNMKMEMALRELSTNPNLQTSATAPNPLFTITPPYSNIEAQYDTFMAQVKLTGDPIRWLGYNLSYRKFELDDKTEDYTFTSTVRGDVGASYSAAGFTREHEGWGIESTRALVYVTPVRGLRLGVSYGQDKRTYDIREYADVEDDVFTLSADYNSSLFQLHGAWTSLDRKPGESNEEAIPPSWQGATQTDITERTRHILSGIVTFTPTAEAGHQPQRRQDGERVRGVRDRPPRPVLRHGRRGRDLRGQRQGQPDGRVRLRDVLLRHGRGLHPARPPAAVRPGQPLGQPDGRQGRHLPRGPRLDPHRQAHPRRHVRLHQAAQRVRLRLRRGRHADRRPQRGERRLPGERAPGPRLPGHHLRPLPDRRSRRSPWRRSAWPTRSRRTSRRAPCTGSRSTTTPTGRPRTRAPTASRSPRTWAGSIPGRTAGSSSARRCRATTPTSSGPP